MEGIPVKISEKYKPPRKITLPLSIQNKLNAELKHEKYDFQLENLILEQMAKLKEQRRKIKASRSVEGRPLSPKLEESKCQNEILTPVPLKPSIQTTVSRNQVVGSFNISDFENDTLSPFDSVELKTLNDMEELAHVLGGSSLSPASTQPEHNLTPSYNLPENGSLTQSSAWLNYNQPHLNRRSQIPAQNIVKSISTRVKKEEMEPSSILTNLRKEIEERKVSAELALKKKLTPLPSVVSVGHPMERDEGVRRSEKRNSPLPTLNSQSEAFARRIAEMGFPFDRVARATHKFGPNEGKVIEWMLEVQSLEEKGWAGERAERALALVPRDEAEKLLEKAGQLTRLGFPDDDVMAALVAAGLDVDKALDSLVS